MFIWLLVAEPEVPTKFTERMLNWSVLVNEKVNAPIHAATAIDTATVTATSMMDAITGLSAFLLLNSIFILGCTPRVDKNDKVGLTFKSYELRHHNGNRTNSNER
jgi:hypothetical protein